MKSILVILNIIFLSACIKEKKIIIKHDFESEQSGWSKNNLVKGESHSGVYYTHTDSVNQYSAGFEKKLSEITPLKIKRIDVAGWVRKGEYKSSALFIVSLDIGPAIKCWKAASTDDVSPEIHEWTRLFASYDLPDAVGKDETLKVFFWNNNKLPLDADDFEIRLFTE